MPFVVLPPEFLLVSTVAALGNIASAMAFVLFFCVEILGAVWEAFAVPRNPVLFFNTHRLWPLELFPLLSR